MYVRQFLGFCFFLCFSALATGQLFDIQPEGEENDWTLNISPYGLLAAQATDVGDNRLRQSFNDLSSLTNSGFQMIADLRYKRWMFRFDGTWANLGTAQTGNLLNLDLNIDQQILDTRLGYLVVRDLEVTDNQIIQGWELGVNLGAKYWLNDVSLGYEFVLFGNVLDDGSLLERQEWWDVMIGVSPAFVISKTVTISAQASIGGFGLGNASKLAYDWTFLNSFKVAKPLAVHVGFRNFYYERTDGEGSEQVETKVNVIGPFLGASLLLF
ncbi:hypothetical protein [Maribacter sp. 2307ULW6-5]|uniref:hypothetical protein n=1 Tax=Maribacter sp. 2307ULW6-5 TaxID=3386275 RepID=UPI0039BC68EE